MATHPGGSPEQPRYGRVRSADEVGRVLRAERKRRGWTLAQVYAATALSTRFLSELERGKENASLGRTLRALESLGLEVLVMPRAQAEAVLRSVEVSTERADGTEGDGG